MIDTERQNEPRREREKVPLPERLFVLAEKARALAGPETHDVTKDEIDAMWGQ